MIINWLRGAALNLRRLLIIDRRGAVLNLRRLLIIDRSRAVLHGRGAIESRRGLRLVIRLIAEILLIIIAIALTGRHMCCCLARARIAIAMRPNLQCSERAKSKARTEARTTVSDAEARPAAKSENSRIAAKTNPAVGNSAFDRCSRISDTCRTAHTNAVAAQAAVKARANRSNARICACAEAMGSKT